MSEWRADLEDVVAARERAVVTEIPYVDTAGNIGLAEPTQFPCSIVTLGDVKTTEVGSIATRSYSYCRAMISVNTAIQASDPKSGLRTVRGLAEKVRKALQGFSPTLSDTGTPTGVGAIGPLEYMGEQLYEIANDSKVGIEQEFAVMFQLAGVQSV